MIFNRSVYLIIFRRFAVIHHTNILAFFTSSVLINLGESMKKLIDKQKYQEALDLFNHNSTSISDVAISLALKACRKLKNLEYGRNIHQQLSPEKINNSLINTSLIHLYMTCGDEDNACRIFCETKNKTPSAYGVMFKGNY
ncbi:unnamed protein product [Rotaria sp. Silwood1]|nr:unnamed protein product [Rotaria sp. Silwood1]